MKKLAILLPLLVVSMVLPATVSADSPSVTVKDYKVSEKVSPGDEFELTVVLDNTGGETAENVDVQLKASYPVSIKGLTKKHVDEIRENWDEPKLSYELEMEESASEGNYPVQFVINYEDSDENRYTENYVVNIPVEGRKKMALYLSGSSKTDIYSDESATLTFELLNKGSVEIESLVARSSAESPLGVKWSSRKRIIGNLAPQESKKFEVEIEANKTAETGEYPLKVDLRGENFGLEKSFNIPVKGKPDFEVQEVKDEGLTPGAEDVKVTIHLRNEGGHTAKEIEGKLLARYPFSTKATTKFIDKVSKKGTGTMAFRLDVDEDLDAGNYSVDLSLDFESAGEDFSERLKIPLTVGRSTSIAKKIAGNWEIIAILAFVIVAVAGTYRYRERLKELGKEDEE